METKTESLPAFVEIHDGCVYVDLQGTPKQEVIHRVIVGLKYLNDTGELELYECTNEWRKRGIKFVEIAPKTLTEKRAILYTEKGQIRHFISCNVIFVDEHTYATPGRIKHARPPEWLIDDIMANGIFRR